MPDRSKIPTFRPPAQRITVLPPTVRSVPSPRDTKAFEAPPVSLPVPSIPPTSGEIRRATKRFSVAPPSMPITLEAKVSGQLTRFRHWKPMLLPELKHLRQRTRDATAWLSPSKIVLVRLSELHNAMSIEMIKDLTPLTDGLHRLRRALGLGPTPNVLLTAMWQHDDWQSAKIKFESMCTSQNAIPQPVAAWCVGVLSEAVNLACLFQAQSSRPIESAQLDALIDLYREGNFPFAVDMSTPGGPTIYALYQDRSSMMPPPMTHSR